MTHIDSALFNAEQSTIVADEWVHRIRTNPNYKYLATKWYAGLKELEAAIHEVVPAPIGTQRVLYMTGVDDRMMQKFADLGPGYTMMLSADRNLAWQPGKPFYASDAQISLAMSGGGHVGAWCDCSATPLQYAVDLCRQRGLHLVSGQFESDSEYLNMLTTPGPVPVGIGNPGNLSQSNLSNAVARATRGHLGAALVCAKRATTTLDKWVGSLRKPSYSYANSWWYVGLRALQDARFNPTSKLTSFIGEVMHADPTYSAQGVPITSACFYLNRDADQGGRQPLTNFSVMPPGLKESCSLYVDTAMTDNDFATWAAWT